MNLCKQPREVSLGELDWCAVHKVISGSWRAEMCDPRSDPLHQFHPLHPYNPSSVGPDRVRGPALLMRSTLYALRSTRSVSHRRHRVLGRHLARPIPEEAAERPPPLIENLISGWDNQQRQKRRGDHTADHRDAEGSAELRALTAAERDRNHPGDERERRHQDRPQPDRARLDQRLTKRLP